MHANGSKGWGAEPGAVEAKAAVKKHGFQVGAASDDAVQRVFRDIDLFKCELLELGEVKRLADVVTEAALTDCDYTEAVRETESGRHRWRPYSIVSCSAELELLEVAEGSGTEPGIHGGGFVA